MLLWQSNGGNALQPTKAQTDQGNEAANKGPKTINIHIRYQCQRQSQNEELTNLNKK